MRADRTVIIIGAFLFVVGMAVAWNGYGYVQLERGWTLVISGTFGSCTGLVLVALGLVLRELEAIASSAAKASLLLAKARTNGQAEVPATPAPRRVSPPPEPIYQPEPTEQAAELPAAEAMAETPAVFAPPEPAQDGPLSWMVRAKRAEPLPEPKMPRAETSDEWLSQPLADPVDTPAPVEPETVEAPAPEPAAPHEPEPVWAGAQEPREPHQESRQEPHEPEAEAAAEPAPEPAPEPEPQFAPEPAHEALHEPVEASIQEPAHEPIHEPVPEQVVDEPLAEPVPETGPKPAVIGHYDAQGAHYTLYADGSIEADTPHGVYRFATMTELKRFIEGEA